MREYPHLNDLYISERLRKRLSVIGKNRVTTVTAPMGYGKTTAVKWWERYYSGHISGAVILRQSIINDNMSDFWNGFCAALRNHPALSDRLKALGYPDDPQKRALFIEIMRECTDHVKNVPVYFILDDVHILRQGALNDLIMLAVSQLPENMRMIFISRNAVFNEREKMLLGRNLYEVSAGDLKLSLGELNEYAEKCEMPLPSTEAEKLENMSEGWISMIYLNFRRYSQKDEWRFDTQDIFSLMEQVMLETLPERHQRFLVENSAVDMFTAAQSAYIWGEDDAAEILDYVVGRNAFIKMNEDGFYRYHHMLLHVARARFGDLPAGEKVRVAKRSGEWYLKQSEYLTAAKFFYKAADWDGLLESIKRDRGKSIDGEHQDDLRRWTAECPPEKLAADHDVVLIIMRKLFSFQQIPELLRLKGILLKSLDEDRTITQTEKNNYLGECELVMSFLKYNDISAMSELHRSACSLMNRVSRCIDPDGTWTFGSPSIAMMFHRTAGMLDHENEEMKECMPYYYQMVEYHGNGAEHVMLGETCLLRGDAVNAEISCHLAINAARRKEQYSILVTAELLKMRIALYKGENIQIEERCAALRETLKQKKQYILINTLDMCEAWMYAVTGRPEKAAAWLTSEGAERLVMNPCVPMLRTVAQQLRLEMNEFADAAARSPEYVEEAEKSGNLLCAVYMRIQRAAALMMLGDAAGSETELYRALERTVPDGIRMPFAENILMIRPALEALHNNDRCSDDMKNELAYILKISDTLEKHIGSAMRGKGSLAQLLTEQEYRIALLAAERKTNAMIAKEMNLTENTVKTHLKHIFDKAGIAGNVKNKRHILADIMNGES